MATWTPYSPPPTFAFDASSLKQQWSRLHAGDCEPWPTQGRCQTAWRNFHRGNFQKAFDAGMELGDAGQTVAFKAACVYAGHLEPREKTRQELFLRISDLAAARAKAEPGFANAHYWLAYSLGRYSQGVSVATALAMGIGSRIKNALETTIALEPRHADAHIALGMFHAEIIDKVGALIGSLTYGAKKDTSLKLLQQGLLLTPRSPVALMEYAHALLMLEGDKREEEAAALYRKAASVKPLDASDQLNVRLARAELAA